MTLSTEHQALLLNPAVRHMSTNNRTNRQALEYGAESKPELAFTAKREPGIRVGPDKRPTAGYRSITVSVTTLMPASLAASSSLS